MLNRRVVPLFERTLSLPAVSLINRSGERLLLIAPATLLVASCADMTPTEQRALTGTAAGAGIGAIAGAIGGNAGLGAAAGAGAGLLGGLLVDRSRQAQDQAFRQGFVAGQPSR